MRNTILPLACAGTLVLLTAATGLLLAAASAHAQTTVNPRALDQLDQPPATGRTPPHAAPQQGKTATHPPAAKAPAAPARPPVPPPPPPPAAPQVRVPLTPPPPPELPPAMVVPTRPPVPPTPATVTADAPGVVAKLPDGVRVTFGEGRTDLNPATEEALRAVAHDAPAGAPLTVTAYAPGTPEDPSTPRRLALSRALAARSILITEGITSERIFVKALGATAPIADGPADRVDVTTAVTNSQARSSQ